MPAEKLSATERRPKIANPKEVRKRLGLVQAEIKKLRSRLEGFGMDAPEYLLGELKIAETIRDALLQQLGTITSSSPSMSTGVNVEVPEETERAVANQDYLRLLRERGKRKRLREFGRAREEV